MFTQKGATQLLKDLFDWHADTCACCGFPAEGMKRIASPLALEGKWICEDCEAEMRVCEDCGEWTDDGDMAEVSFCRMCRGVETLTDVEVE
jgi:hypothetical protein